MNIPAPSIMPPTSDERTMAILAHILTLVAGFLAPLIIYLIKKDESAYVRHHALESLNFQITVFLALVISAILIVVLIGILLIWAIGIGALVMVIIATIRASEGTLYRYPLCLRLIK